MRFYLLFLLLVTVTYGNPVRGFWFAGAEINKYELTQMRYGNEHPGHAEFIFVTEPFLTETQVKNEYGGGASTDVLKLNALRTFNTGIYSYRTMTSTFQPIDLTTYPHALKTNTSVQDWCGQAFQQINQSANGWDVELRSYFQKEGDRNFELSEAWLEDELWVQLRLDPTKLPTGAIEIVPGAIYTRFNHLEIAPQSAKAALAKGKKTSTYSVKYSTVSRELKIVFDTAFPHIIREWYEMEPSGTTKAVLTHRLMNQNYWSENSPKDASKRTALGLDPIAD